MRKFSELSELEIRDLTDEQVEQFIKIEFAENGIKFLERPKEPEYLKCPSNKITHYVVGCLRFKNRDEADVISAHLKECNSLVDYTYKGDIKVEQPLGDCTISIHEDVVNSLENVEEIKRICSSNEGLKKKYEVLVQEYESNDEKACPIKNKIYSKVNSIRTKYNYLNRLTSIFESEYIPIADGDIEKAMAFFKKAYDINEESEKYILHN